MAGGHGGHSGLLKFLVNTTNNTMSESSPAIQSAVPGLHNLRSVTETALGQPEYNIDDANNVDGLQSDKYVNDGKVLTSEYHEKGNIIKDGETSAKSDKVQNEDITSSFTDANEKILINEKRHSDISGEDTVASKDDFTYSPVITVTKEETTLTKGELKLQKVVVSEDISDESMIINRTLRDTNTRSSTEADTKICSETLTVAFRNYEHHDNEKTRSNELRYEGGDQSDLKKTQTKIPKLRLKQVVERVKKQQQQEKFNKKGPEPSVEQKRRSSIPRLIDIKNPPQDIRTNSTENKKSVELETTEVDDEFDKIYEEILESEVSSNVPSPEKICNPVKLESKFEEIIHAYDENNVQTAIILKPKSKIPLLKRKSEREIEIPAPNHRNHSLKRSNTEDYTNKTPVKMTKEKNLKSNFDTVQNANTITNTTNETTKMEAISKNRIHALDSINTITVKKIATQSSIDTKEELVNIASTKSIVKSENTSKYNEKITRKFHRPLSLNAIKDSEIKINSATLNKHPTRINVTEKISRTFDKESDENLHKSFSRNVKTVKSTVLLENENVVKIDKQILETKPLIKESKTSQEPNINVEQQFEIKHKIFDKPTSPNTLTKYEIVATNRESECSSNLLSLETSVCDNKTISAEGETKINEAVNEPTVSTNGVQLFNNNSQDEDVNKFDITLESRISTVTNENIEINGENSDTTNVIKPKIIEENDKLEQLFNDTEAARIKEPLISQTNFDDNNQAALQKDYQADIVNKTMTNIQTDLEKQYLIEHSYKLRDIPAKSINLEESAEEDIITLKGKVNRVIRRLDSKDYKTVKKELDDVPKEVSVISKIAMFERCESKDPQLKTNEDNTLKELVVNDRPKIVNEILKTDIHQDEINNTDVASGPGATNNGNYNSGYDLANNDNRRETLGDFKVKTILSDGKNADVFAKDDDKSGLEVWKEYRRKKEDSAVRRARSVAELEVGDAVAGRVRQLVVRMSSVDRGGEGGAPGGTRAQRRGTPRTGSVSERIAMYESKLSPQRTEARRGPLAARAAAAPAAAGSSLGEEQLRGRVEELQRAVAQFGRFEDMPYIELSDGGRMPALALGTAKLDPALLRHVIHAGIELGYRAIDCAYIYGNEREVGQAIQDKIRDGTVTRSQLFVTGKLWSSEHRRDLVPLACRRSLRDLGLDYFDLYLVHNPMSFQEGGGPLPRVAGVLQHSAHDYLGAWFGVEDAVAGGLARRGGLSNFNSQQVARVLDKARIKPVLNQVESNPYLSQLRLAEWCAARGVHLSCYGVLGARDDALVRVLAAGLHAAPAQLLIRYQLALGRSVVVKCSSAVHLAQAAAAVSPATSARLDASHVAALSALNRNKRINTFKGMGDTHKNYPFTIPF